MLAIWNARVNEALDQYNELRIVVMVRNMTTRQFVLFEEEAHRFTPNDYRWAFNNNGNLEGFDRASNVHVFTWQPHGSQFTIQRHVPGGARRFAITPNVPIVPMDSVLASISFRPDWIDS